MLFAQRIVILLGLATLIAGCASGVGTNRHEFFDETTPVSLRGQIVVDDPTRSAEASLAFGKDAAMQAFFLSGIVGAGMVNSPKAIGTIRGRYQVGKLIEIVTSSMSQTENTDCLVQFHLDRFSYTGDRGNLQAILDFTTRIQDEAVRSAYACDMKIKFSPLGFTPGMEKDMLREMVEHALGHWGQSLCQQLGSGGSGKCEFPPRNNGRLSGRTVECVYDTFIRPEKR